MAENQVSHSEAQIEGIREQGVGKNILTREKLGNS
jgi:hypothetical protein